MAPSRHVFESVDIGDITVGETVEITPGIDYDIDGYGRMFGLHLGSDEGRFVHRRIAGDFDVSVRIQSIHNDALAFTEAGLLVRKALDPTALMAGQFVTNNEYRGEADQYTFLYRLKEGTCLEQGQQAGIFGQGTYGNEGFAYAPWGYFPDDVGKRLRPIPNVWLRIERRGRVYAGYYRENEAPWTKLGEATVDLGTEPYVGMAITANHHGASPTTRTRVQFRDLSGFGV